ncbi:MAG: DNA-directed RNA polymerase subunit beta [Candidatus Hydrothermota bacterium]|nr:MAG: DNA-directed RNA polymerase subunit beta [Candidatus Hydrothermae bacterium]
MKVIKRVGEKPEPYEMPNLLMLQLQSFAQLLEEKVPPEKRTKKSIHGVFQEIFPITDIHNKYSLEYVEYRIDPPKRTPEECKEKSLTYSAALWAKLSLKKKNEETGQFEEAITQEAYICDIPYMTERGTFVINGVERVIVNQLHRSPGVYLETEAKGAAAYKALLVPYRGPWVEITIDGSKNIGITVSKRRKIPVTRFFRAIGYSRTEDIFRLLVDTRKVKVKDLKGDEPYLIIHDIVNKETGVVLKEGPVKLEDIGLQTLKDLKISEIEVANLDDPAVDVIYATYRQDRIKGEEGAIGNVYRTLRYTPPPEDKEEARKYIRDFFFSPQKFYMGEVGRFKLNLRLGLKTPLEVENLEPEDMVSVVRALLRLYKGEEQEDDVDDLSNRRVRSVGELLYEQFRIAFARLSKLIKERMVLSDDASLTPRKLVNPRLVTASLLSYFTTERLSQFLDQTNPLSELTHKRRLSALGKGGLTRETAGFEVRDVHPSHYGRLCPIETPEGQNIGLITSLTTYAKIDRFGFLMTPLRKVKNGYVTDEIQELTPHEEANYKIAPADTPVDPKTGKILGDTVWVRYKGAYPLVKPEEVDFIDVSPRQLVSPSASLIPFLEHDDANRALMGSNMQRQAVPLLEPEPPIVGTGMEKKIARDSGSVVLARTNGEVVYVDSKKIVLKVPKRGRKSLLEEKTEVYELTKFGRSNQNTLINQRPLVRVGDKVKAGQVMADASATKNGELALGKNLLVAFIPWYGYNFEDAIVVSENLLKKDTFTSIHILEYEVEVRETKLGPEEITRDLPNVSEEELKNLDDNGIVRIGAEVKPGDILVGKVTPKGERELTPEERLIYAIFSEKAKDVRDTSKRVPPGVTGVVVDVVVLSRRKDDPLSIKVTREKKLEAERRAEAAKKQVREKLKQKIKELLVGEKLKKSLRTREGRILKRQGEKIDSELFEKFHPVKINFEEDIIENTEKLELVRGLLREAQELERKIIDRMNMEMEQIERGDELPPGVLQLVKVYVAQKRKLQVGDKLSGRHGNKGVVAKIAPQEDMPFLDDGTPVDVVLNPLGVPSRMNVGQILETILGWAGKEKGVYYACPVFEGFSPEQISKELKSAGLPEDGKVRIRDGKSGEYLDFPVTVGYMYMMKLVHMVEDKVHARAIGPYSLITQQPVGGKAHFGGQRFGEMEVWALEAYGAAYTLQEMLTYKSDDIKGRNELYAAIIKGKEPPEPGIPASFDVLLKHLRGLGLDVELETEE